MNGEFDDGTRHRATGQWFVATTGDPPTVVDPSVAVVVYAKRVVGAAKGAHVQAALGGFGSVGQLDVRVEDHELEELGLGYLLVEAIESASMIGPINVERSCDAGGSSIVASGRNTSFNSGQARRVTMSAYADCSRLIAE